jgi:hypothetical protein
MTDLQVGLTVSGESPNTVKQRECRAIGPFPRSFPKEKLVRSTFKIQKQQGDPFLKIPFPTTFR